MSRVKFWGLAGASIAFSCALLAGGMNVLLTVWLTAVLWCWGIRVGLWAEESRK